MQRGRHLLPGDQTAPGQLSGPQQLSGLSGLDLQQQLVGTDGSLPIIFLTGWGDIPMTVRAIKEGAVEFLTKPINAPALLAAIRHAVATGAGVLIGAFAVMTGLLDYIELSDTGSNDVRLAARHGVRTSVVWCAMTIKLIVAGFSAASRSVLWGALVVDLLASALLLQGALFGTRIVYGGFHRSIRRRSEPFSAD